MPNRRGPVNIRCTGFTRPEAVRWRDSDGPVEFWQYVATGHCQMRIVWGQALAPQQPAEELAQGGISGLHLNPGEDARIEFTGADGVIVTAYAVYFGGR